MLNQLNVNQYMYNVYDEFTERVYSNAINYSNNSGLVIKYYKILVDESYNFDSITSIQTSYKNFKYAVYEFIPIISSQSPMSQSYFDPSIQGTSYNVTMNFTIAGIENPLPGDMFHYYDLSQKNNIDKTEIFRVKNINFIRSINNKFPIYQLDVEYAPFKKEDLDEIQEKNMIKHYYWENEASQLISDDEYEYFDYIKRNRSIDLDEIATLYDGTKAAYPYCKLNSLFKIIQKKFEFNIKVISPDASFSDYSFKDFLSYFSLYYKLKNINPINEDEEFPSLSDGLEDSVNDLNDELNREKRISFQDTKCSSESDDSDDSDNSEEIFKIEVNEDSDDSEDKYIFTEDNLFNYYDKLYKIIFSLRYVNDFWEDSIIAHDITKDIKIDNSGLYYNIDGEYVNYEKYRRDVNYDPGYALSYQGGAQYFNDEIQGGF